MDPTTLLIIAGAGYLLLSSQKNAVASTANMTAQQRAALAAQKQQNSLFGSLGKLLSGLGQKSSGGGSGAPKSSGSGSGGGGTGSGSGGNQSGPVTDPCFYCPARDTGDIPTCGVDPNIGPQGPCNDPSAVYGSCVTPCTTSSVCQGTPCTEVCYCNISFGCCGGC